MVPNCMGYKKKHHLDEIRRKMKFSSVCAGSSVNVSLKHKCSYKRDVNQMGPFDNRMLLAWREQHQYGGQFSL